MKNEVSLLDIRNALILLAVLVLGAGALSHLLAVKELPERVSAYLETCEQQERAERLRCLEESASALVGTFSFKQIDAAFLGTEKDCHDLMHFVAQKEYARTNDIGKLYAECSFSCFGACYHGGIEGLVLTQGIRGAPDEEIAAVLQNSCDDIEPNGQCLHGLGHALMLLTSNLRRSLGLCDRLYSQERRESCYGGVFMENSPLSALGPHQAFDIKFDDPFYPCNAIAETYQDTCYSYQASQLYMNAGENMAEAADLCSTLPGTHKFRCLRSLSSIALDSAHNEAETTATCFTINFSEGIEQCIRGVIRSYADRYGPSVDTGRRMATFCSISGEYQSSCVNEMRAYFDEIKLEAGERKIICRHLEETDAAGCLK